MRHRQWSRFAQPEMHAWAQSGEPFRLVEREADSDEEDPKALSCYGVYLPTSSTEENSSGGKTPAEENAEPNMLLRFVEGHPISEATTTFLEWVCERLDKRGTDVWALVWDQASWHLSHKVQNWIREHNKRVKKEGDGVRILACELPTQSPWLNPIEPKWLHGKRAICEPDGELTPEDVVERVHAYYDCRKAEPIPKKSD